jgi:hypothetical protein
VLSRRKEITLIETTGELPHHRPAVFRDHSPAKVSRGLQTRPDTPGQQPENVLAGLYGRVRQPEKSLKQS